MESVDRYSTANSALYVKQSLQVLKDFGIPVTDELRKELLECPTCEAVDKVKRKLILSCLDFELSSKKEERT